MRITFTGFEHPIDVSPSHACVLQIANEALFARVAESLLSGRGAQAIEPYTLWGDNGEELRPSAAFITITNPFELPWKHKSLMGALYSQVEGMLLIDEDLRFQLQELGAELCSCVSKMGLQFNADYGFEVEWGLSQHLKAFGYGIDFSESTSLLDNLIQFIDMSADMAIEEVLVFVNIKTFLTISELNDLYNRVFLRGIRVLLLENHESRAYHELERKTVVDQHFIEYEVKPWSECPSSSQRRICPNGFGAVTF